MKRLVSLGSAALVAAVGLFILDASRAQPADRSTNPVEAGRARFNVRCAGCHGQDGLGGERAPAIAGGAHEGFDNDKAIRNLIGRGISDKGMPAFSVPPAELDQLVAFALSRMQPLSDTSISGNAEAGAALFFGTAHCAQCHMIWGRGSINGPDLTEAARKLTLAQVETALLKPAVRAGDGYQVAAIRTAKGETIRGFIRNESDADLEMQSFDGRLRLLSKDEVVHIDRDTQAPMPAWTGDPEAMRDLIKFLQRAPNAQASANGRGPQAISGTIAWDRIVKPKAGDWPTYHGQLSGNRYSALAGITPGNVKTLAPRWMFSVPDQGNQALEGTPVVMDGVMYVTRVNTVIALDARNGRTIWQYSRPPSKGL
ncbi:MAG TPA: c-type cytochrome, partial [Rhizomicrobium sp.]